MSPYSIHTRLTEELKNLIISEVFKYLEHIWSLQYEVVEIFEFHLNHESITIENLKALNGRFVLVCDYSAVLIYDHATGSWTQGLWSCTTTLNLFITEPEPNGTNV